MIRVGQGFDVHQFADDRPLILGGDRNSLFQGVKRAFHADVLLHAITDAVLGTAGGKRGYRDPLPPTPTLDMRERIVRIVA